jgi:hypothetical protein
MKELDELDRLTKEIIADGKKNRKSRKIRMVVSWIMLITGMYMLWHYTSWHVALAVFILLWSNNIAVRLRQE